MSETKRRTASFTFSLGAATLLLIHLAFFRMVWRTHYRIERSDALFSLLCIGGALVLNKFVHGMVDQYWSRGAVMAAWAGAGMATRTYYVAAARDAQKVGGWQSLIMGEEITAGEVMGELAAPRLAARNLTARNDGSA